jgi:hypothetical protein
LREPANASTVLRIVTRHRHRFALRSAVGCALVLVLASPGAARAQAQSRVDVPPGCGSEAELRSELVRLLGPAAAQTALPRAVRITRGEQGDYALQLELEAESRALRDPDCRVLFKTAVVVAAAAVDPSLQDPAAEPRRSEPAPDAKRADPPARAEGDEASASWHAGVAIGAGAAVSLLPQAALLVQLSGELAYGGFGVSLGARYMAPSTEEAGDDRGVRIHGFGARLGGFHDPAPWLRLQAGMVADRLTGQGRGAAIREDTDSGLAVAFALDAAVTPLRVGALRFSLGIGGHYALVRPDFEIAGYGRVYRVPAVGGSATAEVGWAFR